MRKSRHRSLSDDDWAKEYSQAETGDERNDDLLEFMKTMVDFAVTALRVIDELLEICLKRGDNGDGAVESVRCAIYRHTDRSTKNTRVSRSG